MGLKLAIFNSCDGLNLANELEKLYIPQVIVMKEPIADKVAHKFLEYFLDNFISEKSLYTSVSNARNSLKKENFLHTSEWLPVIVKNPAVSSLNWKSLIPSKVQYVSNMINDFLKGFKSLSIEKNNLDKQSDDSVDKAEESKKRPHSSQAHKTLESVNKFWSNSTNIHEGDTVFIKGALSVYAPIFIGNPYLKRDIHRGYRRAVPTIKQEDTKFNPTTFDAHLAFTAGQMVIRLDPEETKELDWIYMGFYHSIVRNSIPVFVSKDYYFNVVENLFKNNKTSVIEANVTGKIIKFPSDFIQEYIEKNNVKSYVRPEIVTNFTQSTKAIYIDGNDSSIEYIEKARYLDGDIWVALKVGVEEYFVSRFINLSDMDDLQKESQLLAKEVSEMLPLDGKIIYQFDQVDKLVERGQTVESMLKRFTE